MTKECNLSIHIDRRIRSLTADLEVLTQIQSVNPALDWNDHDCVSVHSAVNMLKNELSALKINRKSVECQSTLGAKLKAALISARHRAVRSVRLVRQLPSARSSQGDMRSDKEETWSGLERRAVRFSSGYEVCSDADADADESLATLHRCPNEAEPMPRATLGSRIRPIALHKKDPRCTNDEDQEAFAIVVGTGRLLPLSGTW